MHKKKEPCRAKRQGPGWPRSARGAERKNDGRTEKLARLRDCFFHGLHEDRVEGDARIDEARFLGLSVPDLDLVPVAQDIDKDDRLCGLPSELEEGAGVSRLLEGSVAAWQDESDVGELEHDALTLLERTDVPDLVCLESPLNRGDEVRDDAGHVAAVPLHGSSENPHAAEETTAVHKSPSLFGDIRPEHAGRQQVLRIVAIA